MPKKEPPNLSAYELQRQANIAERDALLKQLALDAATVGLAPKPLSRGRPPTNGAITHKKKPLVKKVKEEVVPRRTSSRLAGLTADSEVAKRKAEDEYGAVREAERVKRQRVSGTVELGDIVVAGQGWDKRENFLVDVVARGAKPYERTFGDVEVKETSDRELKALREKMSGLELYDGWEPNRIKIVPERIYSLAFHPTPEKPLIFAGDKLGNLGIFDASQTSAPSHSPSPIKPEEAEDDIDSYLDSHTPTPAITSFHLHTRTISSFQFSPLNPSHLYTSSYDSSVRLLDLAASTSTEIYGPQDPSADEALSGVEIDSVSPHVLYFSRLDGVLGRIDTRAPSSHSPDLYQLSEKKIGGFSLHPRYPHFLATASLDRYMRVWDLRKITGRGDDRRPAMVGEHLSPLSVSHAAFNSVGQVATTSYDDTIKIHSFKDMSAWNPGAAVPDHQIEPRVIKHNNQTGRWVTILRPQWQASPPPQTPQRFCIGNMNRFVDIYTASGQQLAQLGGEGITAVPAVAVFHPSVDWVAGGTASGKLCLWM